MTTFKPVEGTFGILAGKIGFSQFSHNESAPMGRETYHVSFLSNEYLWPKTGRKHFFLFLPPNARYFLTAALKDNLWSRYQTQALLVT